jgi:hypothetical protein
MAKRRRYWKLASLGVAALAGAGLPHSAGAADANTTRVYFQPDPANAKNGETVAVQLMLDLGDDDATEGVRAHFTYPKSLLDCASFSAQGSAFPFVQEQGVEGPWICSSNSGTLSVHAVTLGADVTGRNHLVGTYTFRGNAVTDGDAALAFDSSRTSVTGTDENGYTQVPSENDNGLIKVK